MPFIQYNTKKNYPNTRIYLLVCKKVSFRRTQIPKNRYGHFSGCCRSALPPLPMGVGAAVRTRSETHRRLSRRSADAPAERYVEPARAVPKHQADLRVRPLLFGLRPRTPFGRVYVTVIRDRTINNYRSLPLLPRSLPSERVLSSASAAADDDDDAAEPERRAAFVAPADGGLRGHYTHASASAYNNIIRRSGAEWPTRYRPFSDPTPGAAATTRTKSATTGKDRKVMEIGIQSSVG